HHPGGGLVPAGRVVPRVHRAGRDVLHAGGVRALPTRRPAYVPRDDRRRRPLRLALRPDARRDLDRVRQSALGVGPRSGVSLLAAGWDLARLVHVRRPPRELLHGQRALRRRAAGNEIAHGSARTTAALAGQPARPLAGLVTPARACVPLSATPPP